MNLLLDTNVLLWWLADSSRLSHDARKMITASPVVYVSAATTWEIEIKRALGKLKAPENLEGELSASHFVPLAITVAHFYRCRKITASSRRPFRSNADRPESQRVPRLRNQRQAAEDL